MGGGTSSSKEPSTAPAKKPKQNPFIHNNKSKSAVGKNKSVPASKKSDTPPAPPENRGVPYAPAPSKSDVLEPMFKKKTKN